MTAVTEYARPSPSVIEHRPWWRGRLVWTTAIVGGMLIAYFAARGDHPWPDSLAWNGLGGHLDRFQLWLSDHRNAEHPSTIFSIFNGFASFLDHLVTLALRRADEDDLGRDDDRRNAARASFRRASAHR